MSRFIAAALAASAALALAPVASAQPIQEDDPRWSCITMGDHVCGPHNSNAARPGLYSDGLLIATWPTVKTCSAIDGQLECFEQYVDPKFVQFVAPAWGRA